MTAHTEEKIINILSEINESLKIISKSYIDDTSKPESNKTLKEVLSEIRNELNIPVKSPEDEKFEKILRGIKTHLPQFNFIVFPIMYDQINFIPHRYLALKKDNIYINTKIDLMHIDVPLYGEASSDEIKKIVEDIHKFLLTNEIGVD